MSDAKTKRTPAECLTALMRHVPGLSCAELDRLAGAPRGLTWGIASGVRENPKRDTLERYVPVLGVSRACLEGDGPDPARKGAAVKAAIKAARHGASVTRKSNAGKSIKAEVSL